MKRIWILLTTTLLSACVGGARNTPPIAVYDFGLPPVARLATDGAWSRLALEVKAPIWFDSLNVDYRLAYEDPFKQREYTGSRWAGAPGILISQRLRQQLGAVSSTGNTQADCLLRIELQEFSQIFDTPQRSRGVLYGKANLIDARRQVIAERQIAIEKPAASADAQGGVGALVSASTELGQQLAEWLENLEKDSASKRCNRGR